jgi:quinol monooxygenase YgiN
MKLPDVTLWNVQDDFEVLTENRYKDQQSLKTHGTSETFTAFNKKLAKLDLMRAPMTLKMVSEKGGFSSRL